MRAFPIHNNPGAAPRAGRRGPCAPGAEAHAPDRTTPRPGRRLIQGGRRPPQPPTGGRSEGAARAAQRPRGRRGGARRGREQGPRARPQRSKARPLPQGGPRGRRASPGPPSPARRAPAPQRGPEGGVADPSDGRPAARPEGTAREKGPRRGPGRHRSSPERSEGAPGTGGGRGLAARTPAAPPECRRGPDRGPRGAGPQPRRATA